MRIKKLWIPCYHKSMILSFLTFIHLSFIKTLLDFNEGLPRKNKKHICNALKYRSSNFFDALRCGPAQKHQQGPITCCKCPMTRSRTKALKEAMNALVLKVSTRSELQGPLLVHLIHVQEGSNTNLFGS